MLTTEMQELINIYNIGLVSTINEDLSPSVSPKGTFVVVDDTSIAFGNIRSPQTLANISVRPIVEVCFVDVLSRKVLRVSGSAVVSKKLETDPIVIDIFTKIYSDYIDLITDIVLVTISTAEIIYSPAYDIGFSEKDLHGVNLEKLNRLPL